MPELQQFVMVSPEVWQDLHWRYTQWLWPWWLVFVLCNTLVLLKSKRKLFFSYVALCWIFLGIIYFIRYVHEVHTFAIAMGCGFICQGIALFYLKVMRTLPEHQENYHGLRSIALIIYGVTALVPLSYMLENSKETILLFGWGAE